MPRWRWSLVEFERLGELGVFGEHEHIELIGGELVPMAAKGVRHETLRGQFLNWLMRRVPQDVQLFSEPGWRPGADNYLEPDFLLAPQSTLAPSVPPDQVLLLIEVAHSSLNFDTKIKSVVYATLGVREYWVVNAVTLETQILTQPSSVGFGQSTKVAADAVIVPAFVPALALRLADLGLD